jgi:hypothetical protein
LQGGQGRALSDEFKDPSKEGESRVINNIQSIQKQLKDLDEYVYEPPAKRLRASFNGSVQDGTHNYK